MRYPKTFVKNDFIPTTDGQYKATIFATTHQLGIDYRVTRILRRDDSCIWHNQLPVYKILENGDFEFYVSEPCICKVLLIGDDESDSLEIGSDLEDVNKNVE